MQTLFFFFISDLNKIFKSTSMHKHDVLSWNDYNAFNVLHKLNPRKYKYKEYIPTNVDDLFLSNSSKICE